MNVLVYIPAMYYCHYGFYMEIIQRHLERGDDIKILRCNKSLCKICRIAEKSCFFDGMDTSCSWCEETFERMISFLNFDKKNIIYTEITLNHEDIMEDVRLKHSLYDVYYHNYDVGMAVVNTIACGLAVYNPDIESFYNVIYELSNVSMSFYDFAVTILKKYSIQKAYFFNGRIAINRPMLRACQALQVEAVSLEYAFQQNKFVEYVDTYPQDYNYLAEIGTQLWGSGGDEKAKIGRKFFGDLVTDSSGSGFHDYMSEGALPFSYRHDKKGIVIFNSTLIEIAAIQEFIDPLVPNFNSNIVIGAIAKTLLCKSEYHVYLRIHPNMSNNASCQQLDEIRSLNSLMLPNLTIIWPEEEVDSYSLLHAANKVITFGSTIGAEATLYGKPSILFGKARYAWADVAYMPQTFQELVDLLLNENLAAKPVQHAEKFGYAMYEFGTDFKFFDPLHQTFMGRKLYQEQQLGLLSGVKKYIAQKIGKISSSICKEKTYSLERQLACLMMEQRLAWYNSPVLQDTTEKFNRSVDDYIKKYS